MKYLNLAEIKAPYHYMMMSSIKNSLLRKKAINGKKTDLA
jgi:hypothetical protein